MSKKPRLSRTVLISRQESRMASSWNEHLCIEAVTGKNFQLSTCKREWLGPIHMLRGKSKLFDRDGNLVVPEFWGKKRIVGIADMEYLETENLVVNDDSGLSVPFNAINIIEARKYCEEQEWTSNYGFDEAWIKIETLVKPLDSKASSHKDSNGYEYQLLSRQEETSPYDEYLYLVNTGADDFELQRRVHDSIGPIKSIPQKNKFFNSKGNRIKPKTFERSKILGYVDLDGLGDDSSYAFLERIVLTPIEHDGVRFNASNLAVAKKFCVENRWNLCNGFDDALIKLTAVVMGNKLL